MNKQGAHDSAPCSIYIEEKIQYKDCTHNGLSSVQVA